jgi:hypothetical protein
VSESVRVLEGRFVVGRSERVEAGGQTRRATRFSWSQSIDWEARTTRARCRAAFGATRKAIDERRRKNRVKSTHQSTMNMMPRSVY